jgi:hypothetical protein
MPTEFIPNQAVLFENPIGTYDCLNNDPRAYAQLAQPGDTLCVQWKMLPCTTDVSCEPDMVIDPLGGDLLGSWTTTGGWSSGSSSSVNYDGNSGTGNCEQIIATTVGKAYKLRFVVDNFTGDADFEVALGLDVRGPVTADGTYEYYFIAVSANTQISFLLTGGGAAGDFCDIFELELIQYTDCWEDGLFSGVASWSYVYENGQGKFCSTIYQGGQLYNRDAYTDDLSYHRLTFTVSGWSQGSITAVMGGVIFGTVTGEGTFTLYGVPTDGSKDLIFQKQDLFDGCISQVTVDDYGVLSTRYGAYLLDSNNGAATGNIVPSFYEDRAVICELWNDIDPNMNGNDCEFFRLRIAEECEDEVITYYNSVNQIAFNLNGWDCSKVVEAWSEGYAFGFYFGTDIDNPDFKLYQRLRVLQFSPKYPNVGEEYLYSNGSTARSYAQTGKRRICWFDYVDENAHDTIRVQLLSQKLFIDNYAFYFPTADYEPEWAENGKYNLAQSRIELEHEQTLFGTTCGTQANSICPPQVIATPAALSQVMINVNDLDTTGTDLTTIEFLNLNWDSAGSLTSAGGGSGFDLTTLAGRSSLLSALIVILQSTWTCTPTGTITVSGSLLTIDISAPAIINIPMNTVSIVLTSGVSVIPIPITFS